jgi:hypothetical protein
MLTVLETESSENQSEGRKRERGKYGPPPFFSYCPFLSFLVVVLKFGEAASGDKEDSQVFLP